MRILVTGVCGMIGSYFTERLLKEGHKVVGLDNLSFGSVDNIKSFMDNDNFTFYENDIRKDFWRVSNTCEDEVTCDCDIKDIDVVCHLAAYKKAPKNTTDSSDVMTNNVDMMKSIIKFCQENNSKLLFTSTSDVYGNSKTFKESDSIEIGPPNVERYSYAMSKLFDEQLILNNVNEGKLHSSIARIFGCFSNRCKRDWSGAHLALFIHQALTGQDIVIHGDGSQTRSLTNVSDIVEGLYRMLMKIDELNGEIINLGSSKQMSVRESADLIVDYSNSKSKIKHISRQEAFGDYQEVERRFADTSKANKLLNGWKCETDIIEDIKEVIDDWK
tara:strand:- start:376 stop:1365 length:990 start_codon:yes stop_codon:yes gene_type:complete